MTGKHQAVYTHGHHESVLRAHRRRTAEDSAGYLLLHLRPGMSVLDVGCGPGTITVGLAARVAPGQVTAVELTDEALDLARTEAQARGQSNISFVTSDVHALDFPDDTFDVVHVHQVLQHVADPVQALRELRRVCVPDGIVAARDADYAGFIWFPRLPALDHWMKLYDKAARANGGEPDAGRRLLSLGPGSGLRRHHTHRQPVVFCDAGDPRLVGWDVGGPDRRVSPGPSASRRRNGLNRGSQRDLVGMAGLGRCCGWLAGCPAWRDSVPGIAPSH